MVKKIQINISNRMFYTLVAIGILILAGVGVYASAPNPGHSYNQLDLGPLHVEGYDVGIYWPGGLASNIILKSGSLKLSSGQGIQIKRASSNEYIDVLRMADSSVVGDFDDLILKVPGSAGSFSQFKIVNTAGNLLMSMSGGGTTTFNGPVKIDKLSATATTNVIEVNSAIRIDSQTDKLVFKNSQDSGFYTIKLEDMSKGLRIWSNDGGTLMYLAPGSGNLYIKGTLYNGIPQGV